MIKTIDVWNDIDASASVSYFVPANGVGEAQAILQVEGGNRSFAGQLALLLEAVDRLTELPRMQAMRPVFKRYFLSDAVNQIGLIPEEESPCSVSFIQQPPLNGSKVALWIYFVEGVEVTKENDFAVVRHNGYEHLWRMGITSDIGDSHVQAESILKDYAVGLEHFGANIAEHCIRTWFFVRDVDIQYNGLVVARREFFEQIGLTKDTHYIASTGIGGVSASRKAIHQLGTYAVKGLKEEQIEYLYASDFMNRTSDYGVTFERGTKVLYGDRDHIYVSGTASIDNKGQVVHVGDIYEQTVRMWANVEAVLREGGMEWEDVMQIIVYLRDLSDADIVEELFVEKFPDTPFVLTLASVCRPEWLIEMECVAVRETKNDFADF